MAEPTRFWEVEPATWRMVIDTNVNGPFLMARAAAPVMRAAGWAASSTYRSGHETMRRPGFSPYGPSKAALESETIIWAQGAQDLAGSGVTVNALLPGGATLTGMIPDGYPAELRCRQQVIRRLGRLPAVGSSGPAGESWQIAASGAPRKPNARHGHVSRGSFFDEKPAFVEGAFAGQPRASFNGIRRRLSPQVSGESGRLETKSKALPSAPCARVVCRDRPAFLPRRVHRSDRGRASPSSCKPACQGSNRRVTYPICRSRLGSRTCAVRPSAGDPGSRHGEVPGGRAARIGTKRASIWQSWIVALLPSWRALPCALLHMVGG
jgi:hypothetical protein